MQIIKNPIYIFNYSINNKKKYFASEGMFRSIFERTIRRFFFAISTNITNNVHFKNYLINKMQFRR